MSEYLNELQESARQVVEGAGTPALEETTWPLIIELGWLLTAVPEELDGLGLGVREVCALHTELGKGLSQAPFMPAMLAIDALCESNLDSKADWLGRFTMGETVTTSLVEPDVSRSGNTLSGVATAVQSADKASHALIWTSQEDCVALVDLRAPGVELEERETWDTTRRLYDIKLSEVAVDDAALVAEGDIAKKLINRMRTLRDFALAADALGGSAVLLDMTVEHLCTRHQYGRPLALFQALKHRCADLKNLIAGADALLNDSLLKFGDDIDSPQTRIAAQKAKYLACNTYAKVTEEALQLHGGIGMAVEYPCHLFLKRAMLSEHLGAGEAQYTAAIADDFLKNIA